MLKTLHAMITGGKKKPRRAGKDYDAAVSVKNGHGVLMVDGIVVGTIPPIAVLRLHEAAVDRGRAVAHKREEKAAAPRKAPAARAKDQLGSSSGYPSSSSAAVSSAPDSGTT